MVHKFKKLIETMANCHCLKINYMLYYKCVSNYANIYRKKTGVFHYI